MSADSFDYIIIGSGVGGGRMAYELAKAGARCLILEAGRHYAAEEFPLSEFDTVSRLYWNGGLELSADASLVFTRGKCVGGSSIVNQALLNRFDEPIWKRWREQAGISWLSEPAMAPYYDAVLQQIPHQTISDKHFNRNSTLIADALTRNGLKPDNLTRAHDDCDGYNCMACLGGCPRQSKQSSAVTTVRWALEHGALLKDRCLVDSIEEKPDRVVVHATHLGHKASFTARKVVLAAGAIGTTTTLLRSGFGKSLPQLGANFYCHPQYLSCARVDEEVNAHRGHFQGVYCHDSQLSTQGFKIESNFVPPALLQILIGGVGRPLFQLARDYRSLSAMELCIRDRIPGRIRLTRRGRTSIEKNLAETDRSALYLGREIISDLFHCMNASSVFHSRKAFSVHPMGGCVLGDHPGAGVVDESFTLMGQRRIHVADVSLFPNAPGSNPSLTVMALALRASQTILAAE